MSLPEMSELELIENLTESNIADELTSVVRGIRVTWAYFTINRGAGTIQQSDPLFPSRPLCLGKIQVRIIEDAGAPERNKLKHWLEGPRNQTFTLFRGSRLPGHKRHHRDFKPCESSWALYQEMKRALRSIEERQRDL